MHVCTFVCPQICQNTYMQNGAAIEESLKTQFHVPRNKNLFVVMSPCDLANQKQISTYLASRRNLIFPHRPDQKDLNYLQRTRLSWRCMILLHRRLLPLSRPQVVSLSQSSCVSPVKVLLTERAGKEPNHTLLQGLLKMKLSSGKLQI